MTLISSRLQMVSFVPPEHMMSARLHVLRAVFQGCI